MSKETTYNSSQNYPDEPIQGGSHILIAHALLGLQLQSTLDISNSDISNSEKLEASI